MHSANSETAGCRATMRIPGKVPRFVRTRTIWPQREQEPDDEEQPARSDQTREHARLQNETNARNQEDTLLSRTSPHTESRGCREHRRRGVDTRPTRKRDDARANDTENEVKSILSATCCCTSASQEARLKARVVPNRPFMPRGQDVT